MFDKVFAGLTLPVRPVVGANGASIQLIEEELPVVAEAAFFGGYAEDMLADIGMEMVDEAPQPELRARNA